MEWEIEYLMGEYFLFIVFENEKVFLKYEEELVLLFFILEVVEKKEELMEVKNCEVSKEFYVRNEFIKGL